MVTASDRLTTVISTKGQVILPKVIRDGRHWPPGTRLVVEEIADGVVLRPLTAFAPADIDGLFGSLGHGAPHLSLSDMDDVIAAEAKRRARN